MQLGGSRESGPLPFSAKGTEVPFLEFPLYVKRAFPLDFKDVITKNFSVGFAPSPRFSFFAFRIHCNEDHWISEVAMPVNFPHYFLRLLVCKTIFKGRFQGRTFQGCGGA